MPELKCTVQTCAHNQQMLCDLESIVVGGDQAKSSFETCCDSFVERKGDQYSNSTKSASDCSCVDCKATDCIYNDNCKCEAGRISVEGSCASNADGTECATFTCKS